MLSVAARPASQSAGRCAARNCGEDSSKAGIAAMKVTHTASNARGIQQFVVDFVFAQRMETVDQMQREHHRDRKFQRAHECRKPDKSARLERGKPADIVDRPRETSFSRPQIGDEKIMVASRPKAHTK